MINYDTWPHGYLQLALVIGTLALSQQLVAQQSEKAGPPAATETQPTVSQTPATSPTAPEAIQNRSDPVTKSPQNDRILWTLPNYLTVENASSLPPLTTGQKFQLVAKGTFDPLEFAFLALEAGVNQASNTNPTFGQGLRGYAKRYGLAFGDNTAENFMAGAVFPSALRQDPRYYQLGRGSFLHRVVYAGLRVVITRSDAEKSQFNFSEFLGAGSAAALSNIYHPGPRTLGTTGSVWGTQIGWDAVGFEMKEFWPDVHRYLMRHDRRNST